MVLFQGAVAGGALFPGELRRPEVDVVQACEFGGIGWCSAECA